MTANSVQQLSVALLHNRMQLNMIIAERDSLN